MISYLKMPSNSKEGLLDFYVDNETTIPIKDKVRKRKGYTISAKEALICSIETHNHMINQFQKHFKEQTGGEAA